MKKEMPPEWMWALDDELIDHFDRVEAEREAKYGTGDDDEDDEHESGGLMMQNEYAKGRGGR